MNWKMLCMRLRIGYFPVNGIMLDKHIFSHRMNLYDSQTKMKYIQKKFYVKRYTNNTNLKRYVKSKFQNWYNNYWSKETRSYHLKFHYHLNCFACHKTVFPLRIRFDAFHQKFIVFHGLEFTIIGQFSQVEMLGIFSI